MSDRYDMLYRGGAIIGVIVPGSNQEPANGVRDFFPLLLTSHVKVDR